jgi:glyoxylate/hydroxypyruvate reductase A
VRGLKVLLAATVEDPRRWLELLRAALPDDHIVLPDQLVNPASIEVALVAKPPAGLLRSLPGLRLIQSLWMGVDGLLADPTLPADVPLARCIDPGMIAAMSEIALAHVLDFHRHLYRYREQQAQGVWRQLPQRLAAETTVGVLGLGELGRATAGALLGAGFPVLGWSRRPRAVAGLATFAGSAGLEALLPRCQVVVCLLPLTVHTRGLLDAPRLALLPKGAGLVSLARGAHVVEADLLAALDVRHLAHAWLDVFETEPLPAAHPFWRHPGITLTPHVAALTDPRTATAMIAANLDLLRRGETPLHLVDRTAGY